DSIPAVFGVTQNAFIVFAANVFALLGLRPLFFLVSGLLDRLVYLSTGLAVVLGFIGVKLMLHFAHLHSDAMPEISTGLSLCVIAGILAVTTVASLLKTRRHPRARAHAGSLRGGEPSAHTRVTHGRDGGGQARGSVQDPALRRQEHPPCAPTSSPVGRSPTTS
ncbi:MAG TPA: hypothetical protein VGG07_21470, partial [Solirubrobacteraceae bacterium]